MNEREIGGRDRDPAARGPLHVVERARSCTTTGATCSPPTPSTTPSAPRTGSTTSRCWSTARRRVSTWAAFPSSTSTATPPPASSTTCSSTRPATRCDSPGTTTSTCARPRAGASVGADHVHATQRHLRRGERARPGSLRRRQAGRVGARPTPGSVQGSTTTRNTPFDLSCATRNASDASSIGNRWVISISRELGSRREELGRLRELAATVVAAVPERRPERDLPHERLHVGPRGVGVVGADVHDRATRSRQLDGAVQRALAAAGLDHDVVAARRSPPRRCVHRPRAGAGGAPRARRRSPPSPAPTRPRGSRWHRRPRSPRGCRRRPHRCDSCATPPTPAPPTMRRRRRGRAAAAPARAGAPGTTRTSPRGRTSRARSDLARTGCSSPARTARTRRTRRSPRPRRASRRRGRRRTRARRSGCCRTGGS